MKYILLFFLVAMGNIILAQDKPVLQKKERTTIPPNKNRSLPDEKSEPITSSIKDYKIISFAKDTTYIDTTLTMHKEYTYNYLREDDFELIPFSNVAQPYNRLGVSFERKNMYPKLGAKARHFNYAEMEDVKYYNVATPMTDALFKTTFEEGQLLDIVLTFNTSKRLNFSIGYEGLRSRGKYQFNESESGNFKASSNYVTKNGRYAIRAHVAAQDMTNEENGGLANAESEFESNDPDFTDRVKVNIRFNDATNKILGKRYFFDHRYKLIKKQKDSSRVEKTSLAIGHQFNYETKFYQFQQSAQNAYFGDGLLTAINDKAKLKTMYNQVSVDFYNATLGSLQANLSLYNYNYFFNSLFIDANQQVVENQLKGKEIALGGNYQKQIGGFLVNGAFKYNLSGDLTGAIVDASASYQFNDDNKITASFHSSARMPDFNFLLYQSDYENYNWQNTSNFEKESVNSLAFNFETKKWGNLSGNLATIDNYAYFAFDPNQLLTVGEENAFIRPFQETNSIEHLKIKYNKEVKVGQFALNNTVMYQNVSQSNNVLNVPQLVTRNTLYFSSDVFKKAMFIQTGFTFKYFTSYSMNGYNPVLGEFYVQSDEKLGGFPLLDFFINAKVQQTRIFLKAEHFNASFGKRNYYAAPNYPYRDFVIRFGLVWNFFS